MRILFILAILLTSCLLGKAQELKTKKQQNEAFTELFQVDKKTRQRNGSFLKLSSQNNDTLVIGQYASDSVSGIWTYYDLKNEPYLKYDHTNDSCLWVSELASKPDTFPIRIKKNFGFAQLQRPPLYIGFRKELDVRFASQLKAPVEIMKKGESLTGMATFVVTRYGKISEIETGKIENKQLKAEVDRIFNAFAGNWLPGIYNGQKVDTKLYVFFQIDPAGVEFTKSDKPYISTIGISYFGITETKVMQTKVVRTTGQPLFRGVPSGTIPRGF
ncbi:MAG TPA: hypothetical protein DHV48_07015 [Prolixibacteraceae bacterium]|nr:hypothetical protein [Prolixibacteraceae bacterium]